MAIPLSCIPRKRTSKSPTTVQLCPKFTLGMPLFKQKKIENMKVVIYFTFLLDTESHRHTTELVKHMQ